MIDLFLEELFKKVDFEERESADDKKLQKYTVGKTLFVLIKFKTHFKFVYKKYFFSNIKQKQHDVVS